MKNETQWTHPNPRMRIYISREETRKKVNAVISRHLEAMSEELARELADSIDLDTEFGKTLERFICLNDTNANSNMKNEVSLSHDVVSVGKPTLPETYHGFVNSTVNLNGRMEGCFPFDIYLTLKPFDYRKRAIDELRLWYNNLTYCHNDDPSDTDIPEKVVFRMSDLLSEMEEDFEELENGNNEEDEMEFWIKIDSLRDSINYANAIFLKYNERWKNKKGLMKCY